MIARLSVVWLVLLALVMEACQGKPERALDRYGELPPFALVDQAGKPFRSAELSGKVWAGAFIFTRCPTVCPKMMESMKRLQASARAEEIPLTLVTFTVDPEHDTPAVLSSYAERHGVDLSSWVFLTGDADSIKDTAQRGFKIAVEGSADAAAADYGIVHGTQLVLVDRELQIRGYYPTSDAGSQARLLAAARALQR